MNGSECCRVRHRKPCKHSNNPPTFARSLHHKTQWQSQPFAFTAGHYLNHSLPIGCAKKSLCARSQSGWESAWAPSKTGSEGRLIRTENRGRSCEPFSGHKVGSATLCKQRPFLRSGSEFGVQVSRHPCVRDGSGGRTGCLSAGNFSPCCC